MLKITYKKSGGSSEHSMPPHKILRSKDILFVACVKKTKKNVSCKANLEPPKLCLIQDIEISFFHDNLEYLDVHPNIFLLKF
jgi:hypothetical protein